MFFFIIYLGFKYSAINNIGQPLHANIWTLYMEITISLQNKGVYQPKKPDYFQSGLVFFSRILF